MSPSNHKENGKMKALATYPVWLTGSRRTVRRMIYSQDGKLFIKFIGQMIEVKRSDSGNYYTVEPY